MAVARTLPLIRGQPTTLGSNRSAKEGAAFARRNIWRVRHCAKYAWKAWQGGAMCLPTNSWSSVMAQFDRREWLQMVGLAAGSSIAPHQLFAQMTQGGRSPAAVKKPIRLSLNEKPYGPAPSVIAAIQRE